MSLGSTHRGVDLTGHILVFGKSFGVTVVIGGCDLCQELSTEGECEF